MEHIKNKIIDYFGKNEINLIEFKDGSGSFSEDRTEIRVGLTWEESKKWAYFLRRLNREGNIANHSYSNGVFSIAFNSLNNASYIEALKRDLYVFYELLKKRYYSVNPSVKRTSVLIKPTHRCNLDCQYCYDRPYRDRIHKDLSLEILEDFIKKMASYTECVRIIWHGGEPTMVGTQWYERAYNEVFSRYPMLSIESSLMSNGINLNKEWLNLSKSYSISPGMSYNAMYQNTLRCFGGKEGQSYSRDEQWELCGDKRVLSRIDLENTLVSFKENGLAIGTIDVITRENFKSQIDIYEYYKSKGLKTCMNHFFYSPGVMENGLDVSPEEYAEEFLKYFRHWLYDGAGIHERSAAENLGFVIGLTNSCCENKDCRKGWLGLNPEGDLYPCDRYYPDKYKLGNISNFECMEDIFNSKAYTMYCNEVQRRFDSRCGGCDYFFACKGGCNASAIETTGSAEGVDEFSCKLFKLKFDGVYDILRDVDVARDVLNPYAKGILIINCFYSIRDINGYISEAGKEIKLKYDRDNLTRCSEYAIFRGVNFVKDGKSQADIHGDFVNSTEPETVELNEKKRKEDFYNFLKEVLKGCRQSM